jgi:hypothetical protein
MIKVGVLSPPPFFVGFIMINRISNMFGDLCGFIVAFVVKHSVTFLILLFLVVIGGVLLGIFGIDKVWSVITQVIDRFGPV